MHGWLPRTAAAAALALALGGTATLFRPARTAASSGHVPRAVVFVADTSGIVRVGPDGTRTPVSDAGARLMALGDDGSLYAVRGDDKIVQIRPDGADVSLPFADLGLATGLAVDRDGIVYVATRDRGIRTMKPGAVKQGSVALTGLRFIAGMAVDEAGTVHAASTDGGRIVSRTLAGQQTSSFALGLYGRPVALAADRGSNLYVVDRDTDRVIRIGPAGKHATLGSGGFDGLAVAEDGGVYATDLDNDRVVRLAEGAAPAPMVTGLTGVTALAVRTVPNPPTEVKAAAGDGQAEVKWFGATGNGGRPINAYVVTASPGGRTCTTAGDRCIVTGLINDVSYTFSVRATNTGNEIGTSIPSLSTAVVRPQAPFTEVPTSSSPEPDAATPAPSTSASDAPSASSPVTVAPITSAPVSMPPVTSPSVSVPSVSVPSVTSAPVSVPSVTSAPVSMPPVTSAPVSMPPVTSAPVSIPPVTSAPASVAPVTSAPASVAPVTSAPTTTPVKPSAPGGVSVRAGYSSIDVSWAASDGAVRYRAVAGPGPAMCETSTTNCVLGGTAGTSYTVKVLAFGDTGAWSESVASAVVTPVLPPIAAEPPRTGLKLGTDNGATARPGHAIVVSGTGYAAHSTVRISVYSEPVTLVDAVADETGAFRVRVSVPENLSAGAHSLVASGVDPSGSVRAMRLDLTVAHAGDPLPVTGDAVLVQVLAGLVFVIGGVLLRRVRPDRR
ncbi:hypothetical protein KOI35_15495 [Actinoplanes bogorensis]|uniref:Fibronectin type-III domain-containing protein n=1 Tax=Paractinoplanes bogorensis TaxID=1610840 RepID=A0ABS5YNK9_9ACTN|nr:hypothetical protein [Actinoplanes bogorensis]MBU2664906.1 hypothetical protein [Actinoplanes bogorensis]